MVVRNPNRRRGRIDDDPLLSVAPRWAEETVLAESGDDVQPSRGSVAREGLDDHPVDRIETARANRTGGGRRRPARPGLRPRRPCEAPQRARTRAAASGRPPAAPRASRRRSEAVPRTCLGLVPCRMNLPGPAERRSVGCVGTQTRSGLRARGGVGRWEGEGVPGPEQG